MGKKPFRLCSDYEDEVTGAEANLWRLPDSTEISGEICRINTDFRAGIAYAQAAMAGKQISQAALLALFFPDGAPGDRDAAVRAVNDFFSAGQQASRGEGEKRAPLISYSVDAEVISAEFQRVYQIDLSTAELHWWRFLALLRGLISHSFSERVRYRAANPNDIKDKNMRSQWQRLKRAYALDEHGQSAYEQEPQTLEELNAMLLAQARGER